MSETDPRRRKGLLINPRHLHYISEGRDLDGTLDPISPNGGSDALGHPKHVGASRQVAILEIPPYRDLNTSTFNLVPARRGGVVGVVKCGIGEIGDLKNGICEGYGGNGYGEKGFHV